MRSQEPDRRLRAEDDPLDESGARLFRKLGDADLGVGFGNAAGTTTIAREVG